MVQMKGSSGVHGGRSSSFLYIPHGSDERTMKLYELDNHKLLYIPHGSDERGVLNPCFFFIAFLYIPHGSDESERIKEEMIGNPTSLYPTWFR